ncbi:MAG: hypothetical protein LBU58_07955 [Clostridiales bacterium]|jgi:N-glycosylase/DNA lyase|nr:hypothetical protein [Clostridiales bacterium]
MVISAHFDLKATLASGQTFAFVPFDGGFLGIADKRPVWVRETRDAGGSRSFGSGQVCPSPRCELHCEPGDAGFWQRYFDLDSGDYAERLAPYTASGSSGGGEYLAACVRAYPGLRLLRQPVWEALCAFIISANNHQKRIESIYRAISARRGDPAALGDRAIFAFPGPEQLARASEAELREAGAGYRAPYLLDTARRVAEGFALDGLDAMDYESALAALTTLRGVGEKVADCVLLFSTRHGRAFPVDVWMERTLRERFGMSGPRRALKREAQAVFGEDAGLAQQYLFHAARSGL